MGYITDIGASTILRQNRDYLNAIDDGIGDIVKALRTIETDAFEDLLLDERDTCSAVLVGVLFGIDLDSAENVLNLLDEQAAAADSRASFLPAVQSALYEAAKSVPSLSGVIGEFKGMHSDSMEASIDMHCWEADETEETDG